MTKILEALAQYPDLDYYIDPYTSDGHEIVITTIEEYEGDPEKAYAPFRKWVCEHMTDMRDVYYIGEYTLSFAGDYDYD